MLYAEGGARKNKEGLHKITLSFSQKEKDMFQNILDKAEIGDLFVIRQDKMFVVGNWKNLYEFFKIFFDNNIIPFDKHTERCLNGLNGFLNHSFTKTMYKYLKILEKKPNFTIKEMVEITNHLPASILNTLRKSQYSKFIKIGGKGINRNPLIIFITKEGKYFLKLIKQIKEVYSEKCRFKQDKERERYQRFVGVWNTQHRQTIRSNIFQCFRTCEKSPRLKEDFALWDSRVILTN